MLVNFCKFIEKLKDNKGQSLAEYGLILVVIALVVIVGLPNLAGALTDFFNSFIAWLE